MIHALQRLIEQAKVALQRGGGIDVKRSAYSSRNLGNRHVFGVKRAVAVEKVIHALASRPKPAGLANDSRMPKDL